MFGGTCHGQINEIAKLIIKEILKHLIVVDFFFWLDIVEAFWKWEECDILQIQTQTSLQNILNKC